MINLLNNLKQKIKPFVLKFFDVPIEENEASLKLKKARKVILAAQKLTANVGYASSLKLDVYQKTGKCEYDESAHIVNSWIYDKKAIKLLGDIFESLQEYDQEALSKSYKKWRM